MDSSSSHYYCTIISHHFLITITNLFAITIVLYVSIGKQSNNNKALYHSKNIYLLIAIIIYQKNKIKCSNLFLMGSTGLSNRDIGQRQRLGITDPISLSGPTEYDVAKTHELEKVLFLRL